MYPDYKNYENGGAWTKFVAARRRREAARVHKRLENKGWDK
jgi:hypothetical protein